MVLISFIISLENDNSKTFHYINDKTITTRFLYERRILFYDYDYDVIYYLIFANRFAKGWQWSLMTPTFNQCRTFKQCFKHYKVHANKLLILKTACVLFCVILCGMSKTDKKWDHIMVKTLCV